MPYKNLKELMKSIHPKRYWENKKRKKRLRKKCDWVKDIGGAE